MRISIIGSGNVATHMAAAFKNAGHKIVQVYSPNQHNAALLAYHVSAGVINDMAEIDQDTDVFLIAVKDDVIQSVAQRLAPYQKLTLHTSGATDLQTILQYNSLSGVLYPLQTFSKIKEVDFWQVPLCIEAGNSSTLKQVEQLAQTISNNVQQVSSEQRKVLHLAAVFACNFTNNLYAIAEQLLVTHQLDFNLMRPLIRETAEKINDRFPLDVQTGPAIRNDEKTIAAHLSLLADKPQLQLVYELLSQSIIKMGVDTNANK